MDNKKELIRSFGKELGLDAIGFSKIDLNPHYHLRYKQWIEKGFHAQMDFLSRRLKEEDIIRARIPTAKTVITTAINYYRPDTDSKRFQQTESTGLVSRYAVTRDYHKVLGNKLKKLCHFIETQFQATTRFYVDTGPIMERAYAETSGIGYIGKNGLLISGDYGSWTFLGVVITDLEIEPGSNRLPLRCGECRRCIDACPTKAIGEDGLLNSSRCISYLTIENRGAIPAEFRETLKDMVFGCDICQEVCPHNCRAKHCNEEDFKQERFVGRRLSLHEILNMKTDEEFTRRFQGTPIMRAKRRGLQRNACIAVGNSGDSTLIPLLKDFVSQSNDPLLREHAQWAIHHLAK